MMRKFRSSKFESLEARRCLSAIAFVEHFVGQIALELDSTVAFDADGDDDMDLLILADEGSSIHQFRNQDNGASFQYVGDVGEDTNDLEILPSDVDGDGDMDFVTQGQVFDRVAWYENANGEGNSWIYHPIRGHVSPEMGYDAILADLDGDGDEDIVSSYGKQIGFETIFAIGWIENLGSGTFAERERLSPTNREVISHAIKAGDMDGDGDLDLVAAMSEESSFVWYENRAMNFDTEHIISSTSHSARDVQLTDADADGDLDVMGTEYAPSSDAWSVVWFENVAGEFGGAIRIAETSADAAEQALFANGGADLDGDGDPDAIWTVARFAYYSLNDGLGNFDEPRIIQGRGFGERNPMAVDLDADGDLDVAVTESNNRIKWLENRTIGDVNDDGRFDSSDLVRVFQLGEYEDDKENNSDFESGDWNNDQDFTSSDLVLAFQAGHYEQTARRIQ